MFLVCFLVCPSGFPGAITTSEPWKHPLGAERMLARLSDEPGFDPGSAGTGLAQSNLYAPLAAKLSLTGCGGK